MLSQHESEILNDLDQRLSFLSGSALPSALRVANFQNKKDSIKESLWDQGKFMAELVCNEKKNSDYSFVVQSS